MPRQYRKSAIHQQQARQRAEKALDMAERYESGATLQQIGNHYGITRERVRQLIKKEIGFTGKDGGVAVRGRQRAAAAAARRDAKCIAKHGMPLDEYRRINTGYSYESSPIGRYRRQRANSNVRGISWRLTFAEWWRIWEKSGKWSERGRGRGYCMSRHGDCGAYENGNVRIIPAPLNNSEYIRRFWREVRNGQRQPPKQTKSLTASGPLCGLQPGQTVTLPITQKRRVYAQNSAYEFARRRGWKVSATTRTGDLVVTRIS